MTSKKARPNPSADLFEATSRSQDDWGLARGDVLVAVGGLVLAVLLGLAFWLRPGQDPVGQPGPQEPVGPVAVVQNSEGFYQVLPLSQDAAITVSGALGTNVVEVSGGRVRVESSDCANQICVNDGWISNVGQMLVCLPHRLAVQVVADAQDAAPLV